MTNEELNTTTQYVDEFGNPIDPSLIDENGNYIGNTSTQYVDEFGNPIDPSLIDENGNYIGNKVQEETITSDNITSSLDNATAPTIISAGEKQMDSKEMLTGMVTFDYNNIPITDIVNSIILDAINKGASDIHFDPFDEGIKIRIRIDGVLNDYSIVPLFVKKNMITRIKIISGMNITESRMPQDGAIRTELQNKTIDIRVSCLPTNLGEKIVLRIMDYSMSAQGIEALDFAPENLEKVKKMLALPNGIILVTGATGTGKSTTVYSMLQRLNVEGTNLITVEDPIEMSIAGINQVQTQSEIGLDFATVLRSILRQDPDVIMIGEIRDDETARIAVRASITGHLVLSTIHTNNSLNTIERLTDMNVERYLLGSALSGIVSQKLARRLCDKCRKLRPTTDYEKEIFKKALNKDVNEIYEPVGCPHCQKGYRGRIAIHEVLLVNQIIKDGIAKGVDKAILRNLVYKDSQTMLQDGLTKALDGRTSFDEIIKLIDLEDDLGTGSELGLENQLFASNIGTTPTYAPMQASGPININITPDMIASLSNLNTNKVNEEPKEEIKKEPKKEVEIENKEIKITISNEDYIKKLFDLENQINKKKFNLKVKEIINNIDKEYKFTEDDKNNGIKFIEKINEQQHKINDKDLINEYEESIKLIKNLFNIDFKPEEKKEESLDDILNQMNEIMIDSMDEDYNFDDFNDFDIIENDEII